MHNTQTQQFMKADEIARRLDCGKSTIYSLAKARKIPSIGLGKTGVRFDYAAVVEALKR